MQPRFLLMLLPALIALLFSPFALAHTGAGHVAGFADGFMHPVTGLDHLLVAVAAGIWAARSGDHGVSDIMFFLALLLAGLLLGFVCLTFPLLQMQTLLVLLVAALITIGIAAPQYFAYLFFGGFAVYHGIVHILVMPAPAAVLAYGAGLFFSTGLLVLLGLIIRQVVVTRNPHSDTTL